VFVRSFKKDARAELLCVCVCQGVPDTVRRRGLGRLSCRLRYPRLCDNIAFLGKAPVAPPSPNPTDDASALAATRHAARELTAVALHDVRSQLSVVRP